MNPTFPMVAKTFKGLEDVLRDELITLGAQNVETGIRMVTFDGDLEMMYKANLCCRTALRILKPIVKFTASSTDELYDEVRDIDWEEFLTPDSTFAIDSTVNSAEFTHSKFVTYRVKDGIADHFYDKYQRRPSIRLSGADVQLNVHISDNRVTISLDSSGEPLIKRGYRVEQTEAPINEVLAAGIIMKTGWKGESNFFDPMCGSGTFLIEAALIAANINPGIYRENFAFERWNDFDRELFESLYNDDSAEREFAFRIYGSDISPEAIAIARKNIKAARIDDMVELACRPFAECVEPPEAGIMITNPPYGERIKPDDMNALYHSIGSTLKKYYPGWHAWILGYKEEHFADIGLKPSVKFPILNGNLECSLREYVLFDGSYNDFKTAGGTVHNDTFNRETQKKFKHQDDREWQNETRRFNAKRRRDSERMRKDDDNDDRRKDFRKDDRHKDFKRDDRRKDFRKDDRRKDFKRDDRREDFRKDDRRKDFKRDDRRKDFRKDDRRTDRQGRGKNIEPVIGKGPSLPESATKFSSQYSMRSRRHKKDDFEAED
jgi:putative N6-adenine-specific DNA methylase